MDRRAKIMRWRSTLDGWHRFVATSDADLLRPRPVDYMVFRSTFVQSPGETIEFEVMIRPVKATVALGEATGSRIGPQLARLKALAAAQGGLRLIFAAFGGAAGVLRACASGGLVARIGRLAGSRFGRFCIRACCRSSVVEHSIGNGEVDSSILSGSTSFYNYVKRLLLTRA
jgi:hypothetical protein